MCTIRTSSDTTTTGGTMRKTTALLTCLVLLSGGSAVASAGPDDDAKRYRPGAKATGPGLPGDHRLPGHTELVATGEFVTDPIVDRRCNGNTIETTNPVLPDGGFIERKAHFSGELHANDPRMTGPMDLDAVGFYDGAVGSFDGVWSVWTATGEARGTLVGVIDRYLGRGWLSGRLADGSRVSANFSVVPATGADGKVHYAVEIGGASPVRSAGLIEQGSCAPYTSEPYNGQLPTGRD
jgi:hypothetical protein